MKDVRVDTSDVDLMTTAQAAARLQVTPQWLTRAAAAGIVPSRRLGKYRRFTESDLAAYLDSVRDGGNAARINVIRRTPRSKAS